MEEEDRLGWKEIKSGMFTIKSFYTSFSQGRSSHSQALAMKLVQLMLSTVSLDIINNEYSSELSMMVAVIAREFAVLHDALKFEALHLLSAILSSKYSAPVHDTLRIMSNDIWSTYVRVGIVAILQNRVGMMPLKKIVRWNAIQIRQVLLRHVGLGYQVSVSMMIKRSRKWVTQNQDTSIPDVLGVLNPWENHLAPAEKLQALILAESVISILGERWLLGQMNLPDAKDSVPADRCLLLVLESSRVEVAVLLNELAYLKYETSNNSSSNAEIISLKQRNLAIAFSLVEKTIKLISNVVEDEVNPIDENTLSKVISGLNETVGVVLEYLQDAKDHGHKKGDDLLASVRLIGRYAFMVSLPRTSMFLKFVEELKVLSSIRLSSEAEVSAILAKPEPISLGKALNTLLQRSFKMLLIPYSPDCSAKLIKIKLKTAR
ncbi:hypothetical protein AAG906_017239 [Vitis piasezkii]